MKNIGYCFVQLVNTNAQISNIGGNFSILESRRLKCGHELSVTRGSSVTIASIVS